MFDTDAKPLRRFVHLSRWLASDLLAKSPAPTNQRIKQSTHRPRHRPMTLPLSSGHVFLHASRGEPLNEIYCANRGAIWQQPARSCTERASITAPWEGKGRQWSRAGSPDARMRAPPWQGKGRQWSGAASSDERMSAPAYEGEGRRRAQAMTSDERIRDPP